MAKVSGLPTTVSVGGSAIGPDVGSLTLSTPYGVQDITAVNSSAMERLLLRADAQLTLNAFFNASLSHAALKTPGSKAIVIVYANGAVTATFTAVQTDCTWDLAADGSLTMTAPFQLSSGTAVAWT